jgi:hypothetical protein
MEQSTAAFHALCFLNVRQGLLCILLFTAVPFVSFAPFAPLVLFALLYARIAPFTLYAPIVSFVSYALFFDNMI